MFFCLILAYLSGCSSFVSPFNSTSYGNDSQTDLADSTDDVPYAIGQYLEQIKIAGNGQENVPVTAQRIPVQKQARNSSSQN
jgi:hypothetical protein